MAAINPMNVVKFLERKFRRDFTATEAPTVDEKELGDYIADVLRDALQNEEHKIDTCVDLVFDNDDEIVLTMDDMEELDFLSNIPDSVDLNSQGSSSTSEYVPSPEIRRNDDCVPYAKRIEVIKYFRDCKKKSHRSLSSVQKNFSFVRSLAQVYNWERRIQATKNRIEKLFSLVHKLISKFQRAKEQKHIVHDRDLKRWAVAINKDVKLEGFKASNTWLLSFKKKNRIVSRKITKFVTKSKVKESVETEAAAKSFVQSIAPVIQAHPEKAANADQSGFAIELHSGRTLAHQGLKHIEGLCQSTNNLTHSYTVIPIITASGKLYKKLYMVLQEQPGEFTERTSKKLPAEAKNVFVDAPRSGKMTKRHVKTFYEQCLHPFSEEDTLLLLDSWTGFNDNTILEESTPEGKAVEVARIPPKVTGEIQPLDKAFFRHLKSYIRIISDYTLDEELGIDMRKREYLVKVQSLTHFQFTAPRYENMIKYAWHCSGHLTEHPGPFQTPVTYCFDEESGDYCGSCENIKFIRCSWCEKNLCFSHFYNDHHMCAYEE
ncbi:hypothetical protein B566_EDAN000745 [Ephemera danica]|nr:hypothetical protein B566_EDAN000745 [Ephemera danica]